MFPMKDGQKNKKRLSSKMELNGGVGYIIYIQGTVALITYSPDPHKLTILSL